MRKPEKYLAKRPLTKAEQDVVKFGGQLIWMKDGVTLHSILKRDDRGCTFYDRFATISSTEAEETRGPHGKPWPVRSEDICAEFLADVERDSLLSDEGFAILMHSMGA